MLVKRLTHASCIALSAACSCSEQANTDTICLRKPCIAPIFSIPPLKTTMRTTASIWLLQVDTSPSASYVWVSEGG
jgi:hypothetical protein